MQIEEVDEDMRELVFDFFFRFARFESALKENGYRRWTDAGARAWPSWQKFAAKYRATYQANSSAKTLIASLPKIQVIGENGQLQFVHQHLAENIDTLDRVIAHAQTVRNNLFHGGKHGGDGWTDPDRMKVLLRSTIGVLDDLVERGGLGGDYSGYY